MRTLLATLFSPCVVGLALIMGALALDELDVYGRMIGTALLATALWGPGLLIARGWAAGCSAEYGCDLPPSGGVEAEPGSGGPRPWWRRRYTLGLLQVVLLGGLGGAAIGCVVSVYLGELSPRPLLAWGGGYGVLGMIVAATGRLLDERHPQHGVFLASVRHTTQLTFVVLYALGLWRGIPTGIVLVLWGALTATTLFALGGLWSLVLLGRAAVRSTRLHPE